MRNRVCVKKAATRDGFPVFSGETFISHSTGSDKTWFFFDSGNWEERQGTTIKDRGKWNCDGADNYFIWADNEQYSSKTKAWSAPLNTIFNCIKVDLESRGMDFEFKPDQLKVTFKSENYYLFFEDGKFEAFHKVRNQVYPGTWQCDGEENYEIFTEHDRFSSKTNMWEKRGL
jgi:hypothetical protein